MPYIQRDQAGRIISVSWEQQPEGWESLPLDSPELVAFASVLSGGQKELITTDLKLVRVVEDLIDLLIARGVIHFTDFPDAAQIKLLTRRTIRSSLNGLNLLAEEDDKLL